MSDETIDLGWEVIVVDASAIEARVRVRPLAENPLELVGIEVYGSIVGPYCESAHTLPATIALHPLTGSDSCSESIIPDPCFWTPELPYLYRLSVECRRGNEVIDRHKQLIGLRRTERLVGPAPK